MNRLAVSVFLAGAMVSQVAGEIKPFPSTLTIAHLSESGFPGENFYVLNGVAAFRTLEGLKRSLIGHPKGSTLSWAPGCMRSQDETPLDTGINSKAFKAFCDSIGVEFIVEMSG
jgi:hypothetical protein